MYYLYRSGILNRKDLTYVKIHSHHEHIPSGFSMSAVSSFKSIENKHDGYRGKNCMKKFCES